MRKTCPQNDERKRRRVAATPLARCLLPAAVLLMLKTSLLADAPQVLPGTKPLILEGDRSAMMVSGIDRNLDRLTAESVRRRTKYWRRDFYSPQAYEKSVEPNRRHLRKIVGAVDKRIPVTELEFSSTTRRPIRIGKSNRFQAYAVRWEVFRGVYGEGLLLEPTGQAKARVVALPDADVTPEMLVGLSDGLPPEQQFARRLAENGCQVIVPALIDRQCTHAGNPQVFMTNLTHREWIYRQAYELGRHVIGYEVQKIAAAVDWLVLENRRRGAKLRIGLAGYGEGGLLALYAAALDSRIDAALVSGYFDSRQQVFQEPIYRNVFGLLREFGDAELAGLIAPRSLIVEHSPGIEIAGPPSTAGRRQSAAPGVLQPPRWDSVRREVERARAFCSHDERQMGAIDLVAGDDGKTVGPGSPAALRALLKRLDAAVEKLTPSTKVFAAARNGFHPGERQRRQVQQLVQHTQRLARQSEQMRIVFWNEAKPTSLDDWQKQVQPYRQRYWDEIIGRLPEVKQPLNVRTRLMRKSEKFAMYEVMFDVDRELFGWGYLLLPNDIKPGEKRPVVVCQHGLEGLPESVVTEEKTSRGYRAYRAYAVRLAERGFITYAPHNPYRGVTKFRQLQRKANPLGLTLYSFILPQHQRMLDWLSSLPQVDARRIGFYGLSYGGMSAVRIPTLLDRYALSICSACFNDWTRKITSLDFRSSYMFTAEYDHFVFNQGVTYNHAELAGLMVPRPFMVERGHQDGVAPDEWVAYEYAKVRRLYAKLGIADRTEIEFFDGGHIINGQSTFDFLHRHLNWPRDVANR